MIDNALMSRLKARVREMIGKSAGNIDIVSWLDMSVLPSVSLTPQEKTALSNELLIYAQSLRQQKFDPLEQMFKSVAHEKAAAKRAAESLTMQTKVRKYAELLTKAIRDEEEASRMYSMIIGLANQLPEELAYDDIHFIKKIQGDENSHHETLTNILNDLRSKLRRST